MKTLLLFSLLALVCWQPATAQILGKSQPSFTTAAGTVVHVGDTLHLGNGSVPGGGFAFVYVPRNVFTGSAQENFTAQMKQMSVRVKDVRLTHSPDFGDKTVAVFKSTTFNGCVDLDAAEAAGEIVTARNHGRPLGSSPTAGSAGPAAGGSMADELGKLRKLLDQKVLTKAEYEVQKARLLK